MPEVSVVVDGCEAAASNLSNTMGEVADCRDGFAVSNFCDRLSDAATGIGGSDCVVPLEVAWASPWSRRASRAWGLSETILWRVYRFPADGRSTRSNQEH